MKRLFFALDLSDDVLDHLEELQEACRADIGPGIRMRWTPRENMHLTLKFLGSTEEDLVEPLWDAMDEIAASFDPFEMTVESLGAFPHPRRPRILWAGIDRSSAEILAPLHRQIEDRLQGTRHLRAGQVGQGSQLQQDETSTSRRPLRDDEHLGNPPL